MAPNDRWKNVVTPNILEGSSRWVLIVPGPGDLPDLYRTIYCTATGNVTMVDVAGTSIALTAVPANAELGPFRPTKITAATATLYGLI